MRHYSKTIVFFILLFSVAIALFFRHPLLTLMVEHYLQGYCQQCFGPEAELHVRKISLENGNCVIEGPTIMTSLSMHKGKEKVFTAQQVIIHYDVSWLERNVELDVTIDSPHFFLQKDLYANAQIDPHSHIALSTPNLGFLKFQGKVSIENGVVALQDPTSPTPLSERLFFQYTGRLELGFNGRLEGCFNPLQTPNNHFVVTLTEEKTPTAHLSLINIDCNTLSSTCAILYPELADWIAMEGIVNGQLAITIPLEGKPYAEGDLSFEQLTFMNPSMQLKGRIPAAYLQLKADHSLKASVGQFKLLQNASLSFPSCELQEINGMISFQPSGSEICLEGICNTHNVASVIQLTGKMKAPEGIFSLDFTSTSSQFQLKGHGNFQGSFDHKILTLCYDIHELSVENAYFSLKIPRLENPPEKDTLLGRYYIEFDKADVFPTGVACRGEVSLNNGTYLEKNSGLFFTDIHADISLEQDLLHFANVETFCNGVYFAGMIDLDLSRYADHCLDIDINAHTMCGKISQCQQLFASCKQPPSELPPSGRPLCFLRFPLEGNLSFREQGGHLHFAVSQSDLQTQAHLQGALSEGVLTGKDIDVSIQELSLNFDYNHNGNTLDFSDIQGTLLVGPPKNLEEYTIAGDRISFTDFANNHADFDVWVGDKNRDVVRLAGKVQPSLSSSDQTEGHTYVEFLLDNQLSHFGNVYPDTFQLVLKDWSKIDTLRLQLQCQLSTLLRDLQRFNRTGLFFLPQRLFQELNNLKSAEGRFNINLQYDDNTSLFTYNAIAHDVALGTHKFKKCLLNGKNKDNTWIVDQLQLDELSCAGELTKTRNNWKINFLGLRYGKSLLMGLEGEYQSKNNILNAKVNLLEVNFPHLSEWDFLQQFVNENHPNGELRATGQMQVEWLSNQPGLRMKAQLNTALHCWAGNQLDAPLQDSTPSVRPIANVQVGGNYHLEGTWSFAKDKLQFGGALKGHSIDFQGYRLENLSAQIDISPSEIRLQDFHIEDQAGSLHANHIEIRKDNHAQAHWQITMPTLKITQFRPSILRTTNSSEIDTESTFVIRQLDLENFNGNLFHPSSFSGSGCAYCVNPPRRDLPNPIWSLPSELMTRLGLDLSALCPVAGAVYYRIEDEKIFLTKFKDMYSAGRMSKFTLSRDSSPSYIDFNGNLNIQIQMKQHNLLFKIAELFTVTIEGTLQKPVYTILKDSTDNNSR